MLGQVDARAQVARIAAERGQVRQAILGRHPHRRASGFQALDGFGYAHLISP
jgi:hypothetical protein